MKSIRLHRAGRAAFERGEPRPDLCPERAAGWDEAYRERFPSATTPKETRRLAESLSGPVDPFMLAEVEDMWLAAEAGML